MITDATGTTVWQWGLQGNPFGEQAPVASSGYVFNLRFPGQYADAESGLVHNGFRDYCPACGRYMQSDPIGLNGGLSTYGYVSGAPLNAFDPLGTHQRSSDMQLALVPGQGAWDASVNAWEDKRYGWSIAYAGAMVGEQILYVASFGQSQTWRTGAMCATTATKTATRWGPATGAGPLGERVAATFRGGSYTEMATEEATTLYRAYGGEAGELGSYWTRTAPTGSLQARIDSALLPKWGNTAESVSQISVPKGTTIYEGFAAPQGGLVGGGSQVFIPKVDPSWLVK